jgi:hypothetical protein
MAFAIFAPFAAGTDAVSGQPSSTQANGQPQLTPVQQTGQQLAASERVRADTARFASNIAYVRPAIRNRKASAALGITCYAISPA